MSSGIEFSGIESPDIESPGIESPDIESPDIESPGADSCAPAIAQTSLASPLVPLLQTQETLRQAIARYASLVQSPEASPVNGLEPTALRSGLDQLQLLSNRLDTRTLKVAVFGLVSRGKSAVINGLLGAPVLETGPLHGVTRWPRSVYWSGAELAPSDQGAEMGDRQSWQIEFIDTPGLDEIEGAVRAEMAQSVARQADLILFVVAGEITPLEYAALQELQAAQKPLLLVFNKIDLYPEVDQAAICDALQALWQSSRAQANATDPAPPLPPISIDGVIRIAADPAPVKVRVEWPDGRITYAWEKPSPQIAPLKQALRQVLRQDAPLLIALNTLREARDLETQLIGQVATLRQQEAEELIWRFARYKGLAVALNPVALVDLLGGIAADLVMVRSLARLYGFPITSYQASQLWGSLLRSSGTLLAAEVGSAILGAGKTTAAFLSLTHSPSGILALTSALTIQATAAGYGTYLVGQATQRYLEQGCTWGSEGISHNLQRLLAETDSSAILQRLRQELQGSLITPSRPQDPAP